MGQIIARTKIKREKGWLYYTSTDELGNITICKSQMGRKKKVEDEEQT